MIFNLLQALSRAEDNIRSWLGEDWLHSKTLLLYLLLEEGEMTPSRLASKMELSRGRMSHLLDDMEAEDLVSRKPDPEDGRGYLIVLTVKGRGEGKGARQRVVGLESALQDSLGDAGLAMLLLQLKEVASLHSQKKDD